MGLDDGLADDLAALLPAGVDGEEAAAGLVERWICDHALVHSHLDALFLEAQVEVVEARNETIQQWAHEAVEAGLSPYPLLNTADQVKELPSGTLLVDADKVFLQRSILPGLLTTFGSDELIDAGEVALPAQVIPVHLP